jgi:putative hydrolase of the HAD superfamily
MVIVFDLDDTLYEEETYVYSGFRVVADYLQELFPDLTREEMYEELKKELKEGRQGVFDRFLIRKGRKSQRLVQKCLQIYRQHTPVIQLFPEADACLDRFLSYPLYIVTDGNHLVQRRKCLALGLPQRVRRCFYTYAHGRHRGKPSPYCFQSICRLEQTVPSNVVYVADNPYKDFIGIKPLGFKTIRVLTGPYRAIEMDEEREAHLRIHDLSELDVSVLQTLLKT